MKPVPESKLVTGAVDGELSVADARRLRRLLDRSPAARDLHDRLTADRDRLRNLPAAAPPADLFSRIMARVADLDPVWPATTFRYVPAVGRRPWLTVAVAASLLLGVGLATFGLTARRSTAGSPYPGTARATPRSFGVVALPADEAAWQNELPAEHGPLPSRPKTVEPAEAVAARVVPLPADPATEVVAPPRPASARPAMENALTYPFPRYPDPPPFEAPVVRLPFLGPLADLHDRPDARTALLRDHLREPAVRVDLFAHDTHRGLELVRNAARAKGVTVHTDAVAADRHKKKVQPTAYAIYVECLSAEEVRDVLVKLAADDARLLARVFDSVHVAPARSNDQKDLIALLGTDPGLWKRPAGESASGRSIAAGTIDQVTRAVTGSGPASPGVAVPSARPERPAVAVTYLPPQVRAKPRESKEVQQFLARRGDRKANAVPVLIVVRTAG